MLKSVIVYFLISVAILVQTIMVRCQSVETSEIKLSMSDPGIWIVDVVHLGSKQVTISYDSKDDAAVLQPTWSKKDFSSSDVAVSNIENGRLHTYQHIKMSDCTQSEVHFEINMPKEYINEGKMEFVFSLQGGAEGDYLFNGHTYKMADFAGSGGIYKKMIVLPADYHEDLEKLRKIERVNIIFERKGSFVSAPIKIRNLEIFLHAEKIIPPAPDVKVTNPKSFYKFIYNTQEAINALQVRTSAESMDITRQISKDGDGLALVPQWDEGKIPKGHTGDVTIVQLLGAPHNFETFEIEYVFIVPKAYFDEGKMQITPFVQAGEQGFFVWSGVTKNLAQYADKAGQDVVITLSTEDFLVNKQKKKNLIEMIGFKFDRHGSNLTQPIILKSITVKLDKQGSFKDPRDGKVYKTIKIGTQTWFAENLAYKASDGCWAYQDKESNVQVNGYLYNYETALQTCPSGWHLPEKKEFELLINQVGGLGKNAFASLLKDGSSGFSASLTSWRNSRDNSYSGMGQDANFWTSTPNGTLYAWTLYFRGYDKGAFIFCYYKTNGLSVRCIKD